METLDLLLQQMEQDPDLIALKTRMSALEAQIQALVEEDTWLLLLEWEAVWGQYVSLCLDRLYPLAYRAGQQALEN